MNFRLWLVMSCIVDEQNADSHRQIILGWTFILKPRRLPKSYSAFGSFKEIIIFGSSKVKDSMLLQLVN